MLIYEFVAQEFTQKVTKKIIEKTGIALLKAAKEMGEASYELEKKNLPTGNLREIAGQFDILGKSSKERLAKLGLTTFSSDIKDKIKIMLLTEIEEVVNQLFKHIN